MEGQRKFNTFGSSATSLSRKSELESSKPSFILKIDRAHKHLEDLKAEIHKWVQSDNCSSVLNQDSADPKKFVLFANARRVPEQPFSLLIGDVVQNLRSALDHLVFAISDCHAGGLTEDQKTIPQFPICDTVKDFNKNGKRRIKLLNPAAQEIIEQLQPYNRKGGMMKPCLARLAELSNADKHRLIHLTASTVEGFRIQGVEPDMEVSACYIADGAGKLDPELDTLIAYYIIESPDPELYKRLSEKVRFDIGFADGWIYGTGVGDTLFMIEDYIRRKVIPPLLPFLSET